MVQRYNLWFFVKRAEDVPGQWVAHCLDMDVVTQGSSISHALHMLVEAVAMSIVHDQQHGKDPFAGRRAPEEYWEELYSLQERGERVDFGEMVGNNDPRIAAACGSVLLEIGRPNTKPRETVRAAFRSRAADQAPCPA
ncbi:MAG: hypothetical protein U0441_04475 [Polyangiaceae bacterium]